MAQYTPTDATRNAILNELATTFLDDLGFNVRNTELTSAEQQVTSLILHAATNNGYGQMCCDAFAEGEPSYLYAYRAAQEAIETVGVKPLYWFFNDCAPAPLNAATHWFWQTGNRWVAVFGETPESWFEDFDSKEVVSTFLIRDIGDVPTTGTLQYWDAEGNDMERPAAAYEQPGVAQLVRARDS